MNNIIKEYITNKVKDKYKEYLEKIFKKHQVEKIDGEFTIYKINIEGGEYWFLFKRQPFPEEDRALCSTEKGVPIGANLIMYKNKYIVEECEFKILNVWVIK